MKDTTRGMKADSMAAGDQPFKVIVPRALISLARRMESKRGTVNGESEFCRY